MISPASLSLPLPLPSLPLSLPPPLCFLTPQDSKMNVGLNKKTHIILLIQHETNDKNTRTYYDFQTLGEAMENVVKLYEEKLKQLNPNFRSIQYDISDLYRFVDELGDIGILMLNENVYQPGSFY
jgi:hypothetical protein